MPSSYGDRKQAKNQFQRAVSRGTVERPLRTARIKAQKAHSDIKKSNSGPSKKPEPVLPNTNTLITASNPAGLATASPALPKNLHFKKRKVEEKPDPASSSPLSSPTATPKKDQVPVVCTPSKPDATCPGKFEQLARDLFGLSPLTPFPAVFSTSQNETKRPPPAPNFASPSRPVARQTDMRNQPVLHKVASVLSERPSEAARLAAPKAVDKPRNRRNSTTTLPPALSRKPVPVLSDSLSAVAVGSSIATSAAASGKPHQAPSTKRSSADLGGPSGRQMGDSRNRTRSTANPSDLKSPLKGSGSLSSLTKSATFKAKASSDKLDESLAFRSLIFQDASASASAPSTNPTDFPSKAKKKRPPKLDTPVVVKPDIGSEDEPPLSTLTGKKPSTTAEVKAPTLSAPAPLKEASSSKSKPKHKSPMKRGIAVLPSSESDSADEQPTSKTKKKRPSKIDTLAAVKSDIGSEDEEPLSTLTGREPVAAAEVKRPAPSASAPLKETSSSNPKAKQRSPTKRGITVLPESESDSKEDRPLSALADGSRLAIAKVKAPVAAAQVKTTQTPAVEAQTEKKKVQDPKVPQKSAEGSLTRNIPLPTAPTMPKVKRGKKRAIDEVDGVEVSTSRILNSVSAPPATTKQAKKAPMPIHDSKESRLAETFDKYNDDEADGDDLPSIMVARVSKTAGGVKKRKMDVGKAPYTKAVPSLAVKREMDETATALLLRKEDVRIPTPPRPAQEISGSQVVPSISTGRTIQKKSKEKDNGASTIKKRKSEVALGVDVADGGKEKVNKKRRTKTTEVLPTESVTAPAVVLPALKIDLERGRLILTPPVDDKRGVLQQTSGAAQEVAHQAPANGVPVASEASVSAPLPKKRGRPPKGSESAVVATETTSKARPRKTKPAYVTKHEQPIVKVEGFGTPVIDEELAKILDAGTRKPGPKAGSKKNQAYASSGHSDIRWTVPPVEIYSAISTSGDNVSRPLDEERRRPFAWTSDKQELTAAIPALAKPLNGVTSLNVRHPVVVLEEDSAAGVLTMDERFEEGKFCLNLTMIRDFTCPSALLETIRIPNPRPNPVAGPTTLQSLVPLSSKLPIPGSTIGAAEMASASSSVMIAAGPNVESPLIDLRLLGQPPVPGTSLEGIDEDATDDELPFALAYPDDPEPPVSPEGRRQDNPTTISTNGFPMSSSSQDTSLHLSTPGPLEPVRFNGASTSATLETNTGGSVQSALLTILNDKSLFSMEEDSLPRVGVAPNGVQQDTTWFSAISVSPEYKVPAHLPLELVAIIQSHISSSPIILVASRKIVKTALKVKPKSECGLSYLGFFKVTSVEEDVLPYRPKKEPSDGYAAGRLQWTFTCEWIASEQELQKSDAAGSASPWWFYPTKGKGKLLDPPVKPLSHNRHSIARSMHPNFTKRNDPNFGRPWSMLPEYAIAKRGDGEGFGVKDESLPAGWYCDLCGKVNFQEMMRFRICNSRPCKRRADPDQRGYAITLSQIRDPMQKAQMSHPYNVYPASAVEAFVDMWEDGMQTFSYISKADATVAVKHVFTGNTPALQQEATQLFQDIQTDVPLAKPKGVNVPYFEYRLGKEDSEKAPSCLNLAREVMQYYGKTYGELEAPNVHRLSLSAWVTSGSKRATSPLSCVKDSIVVMFLGSEVIFTLTPKSGLPDPPGTKASSRDSKPAEIESKSTGVLPLEVENGDNDMIEDVFPSSAPAAAALPESADNMIVDATMQDTEDFQMALFGESGDVPLPAPIQTEEPSTAVPKKGKEKPEKRSIVVTMVHGDVLILSGDKFDYSIKRAGTGILLIGERD